MGSELTIASVFCLKYTKFIDFGRYPGFQDFFNDAPEIKNFSRCVKGLTSSVL